jgi:isoleucyl-tRNA synthetase
LLEEWKQLFTIRDLALQTLELSRQTKIIGKGLEAELEIASSGEQLALLQRHAAGLKEFINVSGVRLLEGAELAIAALPASGHKCARCWNFMPEVSTYGIWENVCTRCQNALKEMNIAPPQSLDSSEGEQ